MDVRNDEPIDSVVNDLFGFSFQASVIAKLVGGKDSKNHLSVGVSGSWGSGKTSLLNMVKEFLNYKQYKDEKERLEKILFTKSYYRMSEDKRFEIDQRIIYLWAFLLKLEQEKIDLEDSIINENKVIWFDPWFFGSQETVIKAFFYRLAKELMDEDKELAKLFLKLAVVMSRGPDLPDSLPVVGNAFKLINYGQKLFNWMSGDDGSVQDFSDLKRKICERLKTEEFSYLDDDDEKIGKKRKKIVVIIDDLDRLQKDEALTMLKVIRLVTELGANFVIGYDEETLSATIDKNCGGHGREYIRKMINVPTYQPLWEIDTTNKEKMLDVFLWSMGIKEIIMTTSWKRSDTLNSLGESDKTLREDGGYTNIFDIVDELIKTPRQLVRLGNLYHIGFQNLYPKIDVVDYLLLCIIYQYFPLLFKKLEQKRSPFIFTSINMSYISEDDKYVLDTTESTSKQIDSIRTTAMRNEPVTEQKSIKKIKNSEYWSLFANEKEEQIATKIIKFITNNDSNNGLKNSINYRYYFSLFSPQK